MTVGLRRYAMTAPGPPAPARCELCAAPLGERHGHVVALDDRAIRCVCRPCHLLFAAPGAAGRRLRAVPERYLHDPAHPLDAADADALGVPVRPAFVFVNSDLGRPVAGCPSPAGVTETLPEPDAWDPLTARYPLLGVLVPDVEAAYLTGAEMFLVPVDACFRLAGTVRTRWHGLDGGPGVRAAVGEFEAGVRARSRPIRGG